MLGLVCFMCPGTSNNFQEEVGLSSKPFALQVFSTP